MFIILNFIFTTIFDNPPEEIGPLTACGPLDTCPVCHVVNAALNIATGKFKIVTVEMYLSGKIGASEYLSPEYHQRALKEHLPQVAIPPKSQPVIL